MIVLNNKPIKILRKPKNDNLYIYNIARPYIDETTKIILKKKEILQRHDDDEDYWEFLVSKIVKLSADWLKLCLYLKKSKFDFCKKIKIYNRFNKWKLKKELSEKAKLFVYSDQPVDLVKLRKNRKLYKKFENRYCYYLNYLHPDTYFYADNYSANLWFQWFVKFYPEYLGSKEDWKLHDIVIKCKYGKIDESEEPKIDFDYYDLFW